MKGQTQAVTATLVTTVIIGSVATAYIWGVPLLEKRQSQADLQGVEENALSTYESVLSVSNGGSGASEQITLDLPSNADYSGTAGTGSSEELENFGVRIDEERDFIEITVDAPRTPYPVDTWTLIRGKSLQNLTIGAGNYGISGQDLPGVVAVRPAGAPGNSIVSYRIEFRNMLTETSTGEELRKIDLEVQGQNRGSGETTLVLTNRGTERDTGEDAVRIDTNTELSRERTVVEVDLR